MAVGFRSSSTFAEDQTSTVAVPVPAGAAAGDIALVGIGRWTSGAFGTITPPAGFTLAASQEAADSGTTRMGVWVKRLTTSESGSWTFTNSAGDWTSAAAILLTGGVTSGDPIEATDTATTSPDGTYPTTTVTVATAAFLGHFGRHDSASGAGTPPTGFTEAEDIDWMKANYQALTTTGTFDATGGTVPAGQLAVVLVAVEAEPDAGGQDVTGDLTATLPALTADLAGQVEAAPTSGTLTATLPALSANLAGVSDAPTGPFVTTVSGLHFLDENNDPILVRGDTVWAFPVNAGRWNGGDWQADIEAYCTARGSQGYNALYIAALGSTQNNGPSNDGATFDGVLPFVGADPGQLNDTYWQRVDYIFSQAQAVGITVFLNVCYSDDINNAALSTATDQQLTDYGAALSTRYLARPNLVWGMGGDYFGVQDTGLTSILNGVRSTGDTRLFAIQYYPETTSRHDLADDSLLSFGDTNADYNFVYTYNVTYFGIEYAHTETSPITVLWGDGTYDNDTAGDRTIFRHLTWWALSAGSRGSIYGAEGIWGWGSGALAQVQNSSSGFADVDLPIIRDAFDGLDGWHLLLSDTDSSLVTSGRGTRATSLASGGGGGEYTGDPQDTYVTAGVTPDGSLAVIFMPVATTITVDDTELAAGYGATWVDPVTGATTAETVSGSYATPGTNSVGDGDWVLVLQATGDVTGDLTAVLPALQAGLAAQATNSGTLAAQFPALTADLAGATSADGTLTATLPGLTADLAAVLTTSGTLTAQLPALTAALTDTVDTGVLVDLQAVLLAPMFHTPTATAPAMSGPTPLTPSLLEQAVPLAPAIRRPDTADPAIVRPAGDPTIDRPAPGEPRVRRPARQPTIR